MTEKLKLTDIGFISKAHGFNGEVLCVIDGESDSPSRFHFIFLMLEGKPVPFLVESQKDKGDNYIIKFEDVNDEAAAKKLAGNKLYIEQNSTDERSDEFYLEDVTGFTVTDQQYGSLGVIHDVEEYPGHLVARCTVGDKEVLFPLSEDFIVKLDEENKTMTIKLPEGLLDIYLGEK
jgi:16S rRNA processing protein RimM